MSSMHSQMKFQFHLLKLANLVSLNFDLPDIK